MRVWTSALALLAAAATLLPAGTAEADAQWSARLGLGFGASRGDIHDEFIVEQSIRSELLFGQPGDEHLRVGPALEIREIDFDTFEVSAGAAVLLPLFRGYPIVLSALGGYALRRQRFGGDGPFVVATFAWGYRSYNWHHWWQIGLQPFISARVHLDEPNGWEIVGGVEIDLAAIVGIPVLFFKMLASRGHPDEPEEQEEQEEQEESETD
jgi:hypothetical protein